MDDHARRDYDAVAAQIGRPPRSVVEVSARCHLDLPVVSSVPPILDDGTPFPTMYWVGCPLAVRRISRIEATGGIVEAESLLAADPELAARHEAAMGRYQSERDSLVPVDYTGPRPRGGVAGTTGRGLKCLHAHYADHAAGNDNPVGAWVAAAIEPLDCVTPCVVVADAGVASNPDWREPVR